MAKSLVIRHLSRTTSAGEYEELSFTEGVNLLVGPPNAGKTIWLRMLDYLFGDPDKPEDSFEAGLADKYVAMAAQMEIGEDTLELERRWKEPGVRTKTFVNGKGYSSGEFSDFILKELDIPVVFYPKGSPYAESSWIRLSWRTLLRHIYRQERFWGDIADKQLEFEQHAY